MDIFNTVVTSEPASVVYSPFLGRKSQKLPVLGGVCGILLLVSTATATSSGSDPAWQGRCDLAVSGASTASPYDLNNNYVLCAEHDARPGYCLATGNTANFTVQLSYDAGARNATFRGWVIHNRTSVHPLLGVIYQRCGSSDCQAAMRPDLIPAYATWEVSKDGKTFEPVTTPVEIKCCPSTPAVCGERPGHRACSAEDCANLVFAHYLLKQMSGCCSTEHFISRKCHCKTTRPSCKPYPGAH